MAKNKTAETTVDVTEFINGVEDETRRNDAFKLIEIHKEVSGFEPKMWGPSIIGFGSYHYKYASGHQGDAPLAAFSPRKDKLVLYLMMDPALGEELKSRLGKQKSSKGCVYVKKLSDIYTDVLREMIAASMEHVRGLYPNQ